MTLGDRFQRFIPTGDLGDEGPEEKLGEKPGPSAHRWLPWISVEGVPADITVNVVIERRDQTQAATFGEYPVTEFPSSIEILSELEEIERLFQDLFDQFDEEIFVNLP